MLHLHALADDDDKAELEKVQKGANRGRPKGKSAPSCGKTTTKKLKKTVAKHSKNGEVKGRPQTKQTIKKNTNRVKERYQLTKKRAITAGQKNTLGQTDCNMLKQLYKPSQILELLLQMVS
jgi:hypothetical protein